MQSLTDPSQVQAWKEYMKEYQHSKRGETGKTEVTLHYSDAPHPHP